MGFKDWINNIVNIPEEDEYPENQPAASEEREPKRKEVEETAPKRPDSAPRIIKSKNSGMQQSNGQMKMIIYRPERFDEVTAIADDLNSKKAVVLNLEVANRDVSRRIIDFLSGVAYANDGNMRKVANNTYVIVPNVVDVSGDMQDEFDESKLYF